MAILNAFSYLQFNREKNPYETCYKLNMRRAVTKPALPVRNQRQKLTHSKITPQPINAFVFATWIVQSLYFLKPKFKPVKPLSHRDATARDCFTIQPTMQSRIFCMGSQSHRTDRERFAKVLICNIFFATKKT